MSITNELREWAKIFWTHPHGNAAYVKAIADNIDVAHKQAVDKAHADGERNGLQQARSASEDYRRGYEAGKADSFDEGFAGADDWLARALEMAEHGWVELPKDADGVPIRVGEEMDYDMGMDYDGEPLCDIKRFKVNGYAVNMGILSPTDRENRLFHPKYCRHVQPDTWESIIKDAIREGMERQRGNDEGRGERTGVLNNSNLVARCKALAGEDK